MSISAFFTWIEERRHRLRLSAIPVLAVMMASVYFFVMATGGIKYVFSHSMYLPIVLSGIIFGMRGGFVAALLGGLILGPFVPIDTLTGEPQLTVNWLYRLGFFLLIGMTIGIVSDGIRMYISHLRWASQHDRNTQLLNRFALEGALEKLHRNHSGAVHRRYLLMISLSNTHEVENNFGIVALDKLVLQMASRVKSMAPAGTPVYRVMGNQICLLLRNYENFDIHSFCNALRKYYQEPFLFEEILLHGDIHIGVVEIDDLLHPASFYIQRANQAVNDARESDTPVFAINAHENDESVSKNLELLGHLKQALEEEQLLMYFQPKLNLGDGSVKHVEALMRWHHPGIGDIPPGKFIPRAERSTLIDRLTEFALEYSLRQLILWRNEGMDIKVAVNISARNLAQPEFVYQVMSLLDRYALEGSCLELELTESSLMHNVERATELLGRLSQQGVLISIDDFGTGYSSLQYLQQLPVSSIKIDQSFVRNLATDPGAIHIVETAINLAHRMGMSVVAEGVEDGEALNILRSIGCNMAQGYYIGRPCSASEFSRWYAGCKGNPALF